MTDTDSRVDTPAEDSRRRKFPAELVVRGLCLGVIHAAVRMALAFVIAYSTALTSIARWLALACVVAVAVTWGAVDGKRNLLDSDRPAADLTVFWLAAAALAGVSSGSLLWMVGRVTGIRTDGHGLIFETTTGTAWILLLVFVPALLGVAIARGLGRRGAQR